MTGNSQPISLASILPPDRTARTRRVCIVMVGTLPSVPEPKQQAPGQQRRARPDGKDSQPAPRADRQVPQAGGGLDGQPGGGGGPALEPVLPGRVGDE